MNAAQTDERRPAGAASEADGPTSILAPVPDFLPVLTPSDVRAAIVGRLATVVVTKDLDGHVRRRTYVSLHTAEKAVARALERGHDSDVVLVRLVPVDRIN